MQKEIKKENVLPKGGKTSIYSSLHAGQDTAAELLPFCFSSIHRWRQDWWTHLEKPRHLQGCTHSASLSSSGLPKQTQQLILLLLEIEIESIKNTNVCYYN